MKRYRVCFGASDTVATFLEVCSPSLRRLVPFLGEQFQEWFKQVG